MTMIVAVTANVTQRPICSNRFSIRSSIEKSYVNS